MEMKRKGFTSQKGGKFWVGFSEKSGKKSFIANTTDYQMAFVDFRVKMYVFHTCTWVRFETLRVYVSKLVNVSG